MTEIKTPETREIEKLEERLHGKEGVKDEHTHIELARLNGGELAECLVTRCKQLDGLLQERGEGICPLEAIHDQVGPVEPCEVEEMSATNGYTRSLGGMEAPEPLVVARIPSVNGPVCVVSKCVYTSVTKCVLKSTHSGGERLCVRRTACVSEKASVREKVCMEETPVMGEARCVKEPACVGEIESVSEKVCV